MPGPSSRNRLLTEQRHRPTGLIKRWEIDQTRVPAALRTRRSTTAAIDRASVTFFAGGRHLGTSGPGGGHAGFPIVDDEMAPEVTKVERIIVQPTPEERR